MKEIYGIFLIVVVFFIPLGYLVYAAFDLVRDFPRFRRVWNRMPNFEKHLTKAGLLMFLPLPLLKASDWAKDYVFAVIIEMLPAIAGGFFVAGIIAFVREFHANESESNDA